MFDFITNPRKKISKWWVFLATIVVSGAAMSFRLFVGNFSNQSIHDWVLDSLLMAAILGFAVTKWLKKKGKID